MDIMTKWYTVAFFVTRSNVLCGLTKFKISEIIIIFFLSVF